MAVVQITSVALTTVSVPVNSVFHTGPDAITINSNLFKYENYNPATGVFTMVQPEPVGEGIAPGMLVKQATLEDHKANDAFERLASKFPKRYKVKTSKYHKGFLKALSTGDGFIDYTVDAVRDNSLVVRARGKYLDRLGGLYGVIRGQATGVQDDDFQKLIPLVGLNYKQITTILNKIIDVIYGPFASHANITCSLPGPYNLQNGWEIKFLVDGSTQVIKFQNDDFQNINSATASEVSNAITQKSDGKIIGQVLTNVRTGEEYVNIRTATVGSQGFIQVLGGEAQAVMRFPLIRETIMNYATWDVARVGGTDEMEYTVTAGVSPAMRNAGVVKGDIVTIRPDSGFDPANCGSFVITYSDNNLFRVKNQNGIPESGITNLNVDDFVFFKNKTANILLSSRPATVLETAPRELTVILPVTSPLVKRSLKGSHHLHGGITNVIGTTSNTVDLGSSNGFPISGSIMPTGTRNTSSGIVSSKTSNSITLISTEGFPTSGSIWCQTSDDFYYYSGISGNALQNVTPTPPNLIIGSECKYLEKYLYTGTTGNTLTGVFPNPTSLLNKEIVNNSSEIIDGYPGSFMYDVSAQFIGAFAETSISETISQGSARTVITVNDNTDFPDSGFIVFRFGEDKQEGPVRYQAKTGTNGIIIDPGHVFENTHLSGSSIRLIRKIGSYQPRIDGSDLPIYLTSTSPARDLVAQYLRDVTASGISIRFDIRMPDYKWELLPNLYTTAPLDTELVPPSV